MHRQRPRIEPKFHQIEILMGAGRFRRLFFIRRGRGWGVLRGFAIWIFVIKEIKRGRDLFGRGERA